MGCGTVSLERKWRSYARALIGAISLAVWGIQSVSANVKKLAGIGALAILGVGPLIAAGPIMAALSGAAVGATTGGVVGGLIGLGIPSKIGGL